jgi:phosphate transport system substrate-binding protein
MKRSVYLLISLLLAMCNSLYSSYSDSGNDLTGSDSLKVMATPDLYNLTLSWAAEYNRQYPGANISVINVADQERAADLLKKGNIGFVSSEFYAGLKDEALWNAVVGRDVIVPVINAKNPFMEEITLHGISPAVLSNFAKNVDFRNWDDLLMNGNDRKVEYYCLNDNSALSVLADFLKTDETLIAGRNRGNTAEVVSAIQKDPYAIGFCRLISIIDPENQGMVENIRLLPIDRNGNGLIDSNL